MNSDIARANLALFARSKFLPQTEPLKRIHVDLICRGMVLASKSALDPGVAEDLVRKIARDIGLKPNEYRLRVVCDSSEYDLLPPKIEKHVAIL